MRHLRMMSRRCQIEPDRRHTRAPRHPGRGRFQWLIITSLAAAGCSGEAVPETASVTGIVKYKGDPVSDATVSFVPLNPGGRAATATTDAEGKFAIHTFLADSQVEGAIPGEYGIAVRKMSAPVDPPSGVTQAELQAWAAKGGLPRSLLPRIYQDHVKSRLRVTVQAASNPPLVLELKD